MGLFRRKKNNVRKIEAQIEALQSELSALRKDARSLIGSFSKSAANAADVAGAVYDGAEQWTADNVRSVQGSVRNQPLTALAISLGVGALLGALFLRR